MRRRISLRELQMGFASSCFDPGLGRGFVVGSGGSHQDRRDEKYRCAEGQLDAGGVAQPNRVSPLGSLHRYCDR